MNQTVTDAPAVVMPTRLSDNSIAYNVIATIDGTEFAFACVGECHAIKLRDAIRECAWIERT